MKKLAIVLSLTFLLPVLAPAISHGAENYSDLAIGDPVGGGHYRRHRHHRRRHSNPVTSTEQRAPAAEKPVVQQPAAEKPAEPAK